MKILFNPSLSGFVFNNLKNESGNMLFNTQAMGLTGLLELLQMYCGANVKVAKPVERLLAYYKLLKEYIGNNPDCILADSFEVDGLNTAKRCLAWRDSLRLAGWNENSSKPSERLEILSAIEADFSMAGQPDLLWAIIDAVKNNKAIPQDLEIQIPCKVEWMMPAVGELLKALEARGAKLTPMEAAVQADGSNLQKVAKLLQGDKSVKQIECDDSFQIWNYSTQDEALAYLTSLPADAYDVWINSDNKLMDNWLSAQGEPTAGSNVVDAPAEISQLFLMWAALFVRPLNVKSLYAWLDNKFCPLPFDLTVKLKSSLAYSGGFFNDACSQIIAAAKEEDYKGYLPTDSTEFDAKEVCDSAERFMDYCKKKAGNPKSTLSDSDKKMLFSVAEQVSTLKYLLENVQGLDIAKEFDGWVRTINSTSSYQQYEAQVGCRTVINDPANFMANADSTICCDFYNDRGTVFTYDFLSRKEQAELSKSIALWQGVDETKYRNAIQLIPFLHTAKKLTLVTVDYVGSEIANKHPLMVRILASMAKGKQSKAPAVDLLEIDQVEVIDNRAEDKPEIKFEHQKPLEIKPFESASSIGLLINDPLDYLFNYSLHLRRMGIETMSSFEAVRGTVAHEVTQELLPRDSYTDEEFDKVFDQKVKERGAILLLDENIGELSKIRVTVKKFVKWLKEVLEKSHLEFVDKEKNLKLDNVFGTVGLEGNLDLVLKDNNGGYHVFDIKYSAFGYEESIKQNKSLQLTFYKKLMEENNMPVKGIAYVIVKDAKLFSTYNYYGPGVKAIQPVNEDDLYPEIEKSYRYRMETLQNGHIENADKMLLTEFEYGQKQDSEKLFPIKSSGVKAPKKEANTFSNYTLFKRKKV